MSAEQDEALDVLRAVWRGRGQATSDLADEIGSGKSCKRMTDVGFDDFAGRDQDPKEAWRATLAREGKLRPAAGSIKDLVLGSAEKPH